MRQNEYLRSKGLATLGNHPFENVVGKGENAGNQSKNLSFGKELNCFTF